MVEAAAEAAEADGEFDFNQMTAGSILNIT
jgi:hypothetical protein